jgi:hypothetical protein
MYTLELWRGISDSGQIFDIALYVNGGEVFADVFESYWVSGKVGIENRKFTELYYAIPSLEITYRLVSIQHIGSTTIKL